MAWCRRAVQQCALPTCCGCGPPATSQHHVPVWSDPNNLCLVETQHHLIHTCKHNQMLAFGAMGGGGPVCCRTHCSWITQQTL
jgi:hypothetical protein